FPYTTLFRSSKRAVASHLRKRTDAHFSEIPLVTCCPFPPLMGGRKVARRLTGRAKQVENVALVREQMSCFSKVCRTIQGRLHKPAGLSWLAISQRATA